MLFKASAPGSLMLLGEYAVLYGKQALVCAVDKRITVTLKPRADKKIYISSVLGECELEISQLEIYPPFQFILAALKKFQKKIKCGCDIKIETEFSEKIGFGSSAAVTVACVTVLAAWLNISLTPVELIRTARTIVREVQGIGSGADVAACVLGGLVSYRAQPLTFEKLPHIHPITVVYSGHKTPTPEAIQQVKNNFLNKPKLFQQICNTIDYCATQGIQAVLEQNWVELGKIMNIQQGMMDSLGVNTESLSGIIKELRMQNTILGVKISGSGLGDCAVGLGTGQANQQVSVAMTDQGVVCEQI